MQFVLAVGCIDDLGTWFADEEWRLCFPTSRLLHSSTQVTRSGHGLSTGRKIVQSRSRAAGVKTNLPIHSSRGWRNSKTELPRLSRGDTSPIGNLGVAC